MSSLNLNKRGIYRHFCRSAKGSFTLEASLVMPMVLFVIIIFMLIAIMGLRQMFMQYSAVTAAERTTYNWSNSEQSLRLGYTGELKGDGLYWRLSDDGMVQSLFSLTKDSSDEYATAMVELPYRSPDEPSSSPLAQKKLGRAAEWIAKTDPDYKGRMMYRWGILHRSVTTELEFPLTLVSSRDGMSWRRITTRRTAKSFVVEPVEFIRNTELIRHYWMKFGKKKEDGGLERSEASKALTIFVNKKS